MGLYWLMVDIWFIPFVYDGSMMVDGNILVDLPHAKYTFHNSMSCELLVSWASHITGGYHIAETNAIIRVFEDVRSHLAQRFGPSPPSMPQSGLADGFNNLNNVLLKQPSHPDPEKYHGNNVLWQSWHRCKAIFPRTSRVCMDASGPRLPPCTNLTAPWLMSPETLTCLEGHFRGWRVRKESRCLELMFLDGNLDQDISRHKCRTNQNISLKVLNIFGNIPVVPHKAVAEVSE